MADNLGKLREEDVAVLKKNSTYRVSDIFYCRGWRWQEDRTSILNDAEFKDSILFDYLTEKRTVGFTCDGDVDFKTFRKIVKRHSEKNQYPQADPHHLVVHMRLGDVMEMQRKDRCMNKYNEFYERESIKNLPITKVILVTALHFGHNVSRNRFFYTPQAVRKSWKVIRDFERQTHEAGLGLEVFSNENVDKDICFMASSRFFVKGETRLSSIVARCLHKDSKVCG